MYKPEFNVTKEENERAIFDLGSDDEDDDTESVINVDDAIKSPDTTCPVTLLNTLLNANIHQTTEGDAIRKQLAADPAKNEENDDAEATLTASDSRIFTDQRPILTVEPPSPMPRRRTTVLTPATPLLTAVACRLATRITPSRFPTMMHHRN